MNSRQSSTYSNWLQTLCFILCASLVVACGASSSGNSGTRFVGPDDEPIENLVAPLLDAQPGRAATIDLTWDSIEDEVPGDTVLTLERKQGAGNFADKESLSLDQTELEDTDVSMGITFTYRVRVEHPEFDTVYSNEDSVDL